MIKKFIKISGTGKFSNYSHSAIQHPYRSNDFEKFNLIYGENGSGKTTLSLILRSLKGDNAILNKKRHFDRTIPQNIEVLTTNQIPPKYTFMNNLWDRHYNDIEIFDIHFINDNIYTGLEIQNTHKKNLLEVIFGQPGIILKNEIKELKNEIKDKNDIIRLKTEAIETLINKTYTADAYCSIAIDPEIDNKILNKTNEINTAKNYQNIQLKPSLVDLPLFSLPYDKTFALSCLQKSLDNIKEKYLSIINVRKESLKMEGKEETWMKQGYKAIKDDTCPFCLRLFDDDSEIIEAYSQYFNEEYNTLLDDISLLNKNIESYNVEIELLKIESVIQKNLLLVEFWENNISNPPLILSITCKKEELISAFERLKKAFKEKLQNPIEAGSIEEFNCFNTIIENVNFGLTHYNIQLNEYNQRIAVIKTENNPNINNLEVELNKLIAIKNRGNSTESTLCSELSAAKVDSGNLNIVKTNKQEQLDNYSISVFSNYSAKINMYLRSFASYLEIRNLDSGYVGSSKEPMIKYLLSIDGNEIKFDDNDTHPTFKYSLSEGDKSALALAFFLAKLEVDGNIQNKIIVFDDPVSSFDLNRKSTTIYKLIEFGMQAAQLFVLTHNLIFGHEFWKNAKHATSVNDIQCSKIENILNSSCLVNYDIDAENLKSVFKDVLAVRDYLISGCLSDKERRGVARCLRPALESYFRLKFFDILTDNDWLGGFIDRVRTSADTTDRFYRLRDSLPEMKEINDYSKRFHHSFNNNYDNEPVNDAELRNFCQRTLAMIEVI